MDLEIYGFTEKDIDLIIKSANKDNLDVELTDKEFKDLARSNLESGVDWILQHKNLKPQYKESFDEMLRSIARQIAINMFVLLDTNQLSNYVDIERNISIPLSKTEVISTDIQRRLNPYLDESLGEAAEIKIVTGRVRDYGF